jgi:hypothetical protein
MMGMLTSTRSHTQVTLRVIIIRFYIPRKEFNREAASILDGYAVRHIQGVNP